MHTSYLWLRGSLNSNFTVQLFLDIFSFSYPIDFLFCVLPLAPATDYCKTENIKERLYDRFSSLWNLSKSHHLDQARNSSIFVKKICQHLRIINNNTCCLITVNGLVVFLPKTCQGELLCMGSAICNETLKSI